MTRRQQRPHGDGDFTRGVRRTRLKNGLTILTKEMHDKPIVASMIWYRVGSRNEDLGQTGKSHFLEHMLFKGTKKFGKGAIDLITLKNGGSNNAFTSNDYTAYYFTFASDRWERALEIEASRMRHTTFAPKEFDLEKQVVIEELRIGLDSPWGALNQEVEAAAFRQHPYRNPVVGWIQDLRFATASDMKAYYDQWYHPRNATISLAGDFDTRKVLARIRELFGTIPAGPPPRPMAIREEAQWGEKRVVVHKATQLDRLMMAYHVPQVAHPDSFPLQILATILSTGKTSRLYDRLQERDQSVTYAAANSDETIDPGLFVLRAELKPGRALPAVERAIDDEIAKLQAEPVPDAELRKAKQLIEARYRLSNEEYLSQAMLLGLFETIDHYEYLGSFFDRLRAVTAAGVQRVARQYLRPGNRTVGYLKNPDGAIPALKGSAGSSDDAESRATRILGHSLAGPLPRRACFRTSSKKNSPKGREAAAKTKPARAGARATSSRSHPAIRAERTVLSNGIVVLLSESRVSSGVAINVVVRAGSRYESDEKAGLASITGEMLAEGTGSRTTKDIALAIETTGGALTTFGGYTRSGVAARVLGRDLSLALDLASDVVRHPTFPEERIKIRIGMRLAELKARRDRPTTVASDRFNEIVYHGTPAHRPSAGYSETVARLSRDDIANFYSSFYSPERTILAVAGAIDSRETLRLIEKYFGDWKNPGAAPLPDVPQARRNGRAVTEYVPLQKEQIHIYTGHLGIRRSHPDYYALSLFDTIFGSSPGFTSRIPRILRDQLGLAYATSSNIADSSGEDPGRFYVYIGTSPENMHKALAAIRREIGRIVTQPVTRQELDDAKAYLTGSFVFDFETNSQVAAFLTEAEVHQLGFDYFERYPRLINEVSIQDVLRVARTHIDPKLLTTVVAGPVSPDGKTGKKPRA